MPAPPRSRRARRWSCTSTRRAARPRPPSTAIATSLRASRRSRRRSARASLVPSLSRPHRSIDRPADSSSTMDLVATAWLAPVACCRRARVADRFLPHTSRRRRARARCRRSPSHTRGRRGGWSGRGRRGGRGVGPTRGRYKRLALRWHPDKAAKRARGEGVSAEEARDLATRQFARLNAQHKKKLAELQVGSARVGLSADTPSRRDCAQCVPPVCERVRAVCESVCACHAERQDLAHRQDATARSVPSVCERVCAVCESVCACASRRTPGPRVAHRARGGGGRPRRRARGITQLLL